PQSSCASPGSEDAVRPCRLTAAMMLSGSLVQRKGRGLALALSMKRLMAAWSATREWNTPHFNSPLASLAKKPSTAFSHKAEDDPTLFAALNGLEARSSAVACGAIVSRTIRARQTYFCELLRSATTGRARLAVTSPTIPVGIAQTRTPGRSWATGARDTV